HLGDRDFDQDLERTEIDALDDLLDERPVGIGRADEERVARLLRDNPNLVRLVGQRPARRLEDAVDGIGDRPAAAPARCARDDRLLGAGLVIGLTATTGAATATGIVLLLRERL